MSRIRQAPLGILIVEDEALLALDIEAMVEDAGHVVVGEAASLREVEELALAEEPDLAFVDIQLAEESTGFDVSSHIRRQWPETIIVFVTANPKKIPPDFAGAHGVIAKPFSRGGLLSAMRYLEEGLTAPPPLSPRPTSFTASPACLEQWDR